MSGVERDCHARVPQLLRNHFRGYSCGECQGGRSVAKIIKTDAWQFLSFQAGLEVAKSRLIRDGAKKSPSGDPAEFG